MFKDNLNKKGISKMITCAMCERKIDINDEKFIADDERVKYCDECVSILNTPPTINDRNRVEQDISKICGECGEPLSPGDRLAGETMHRSCLNRHETAQRREKEGKDLNGFDDVTGMPLIVCFLCSKEVVEEEIIWAGDDPFHPDCFQASQVIKEIDE